MAIKASKRYPINFKDIALEEIDFCRRINHCLNDNTPSEALQARIREIIYRYGWNPAKYPPYVAYTFWSLASGDYWGMFKQAIIKRNPEEILDPSSSDIVEYHL